MLSLRDVHTYVLAMARLVIGAIERFAFITGDPGAWGIQLARARSHCLLAVVADGLETGFTLRYRNAVVTSGNVAFAAHEYVCAPPTLATWQVAADL